MKAVAILSATIAALLVLQTGLLPARAATTVVVYLVIRTSSAEAKALLLSRLVRLNATNLRSYDDANVVRIEVVKEALAAIRADGDVIATVLESDTPIVAAALSEVATTKAALAAPDAIAPPPAIPAPPMTSVAPPPLAMAPPIPSGPGMGMGMGMTTGPMGLVDTIAGGMMSRLFNRPAACKISVAKGAAVITPAGGDQVIEVKASGSCSWQAQASVPWIKINSGMGVSGLGIVSYSVAAAEAKSRAGSISIVGTPGGSPIKGNGIVVVMQAPAAPAFPERFAASGN